MRNRTTKRPSSAMIVAVVALCLGLTGSAVAGAGKITNAKVKKLVTKQIDKKAPTLSVANAKTADRATNLLGANVDSTGTPLGSVPAGVVANRVDAGVYRVTFPRPIAGCLVFSALGGNDGSIAAGSTGVIPATAENPNRVAVATFNGAGASEDRDFYVQVTCP